MADGSLAEIIRDSNTHLGRAVPLVEQRGAEIEDVFAVGIFVAKRRTWSFVCDGCGERTPNRDGYEVGEDSLTFFAGQRMCEPCGVAHGLL